MKERILVVDDDVDICELLKMYLEEEFTVEVVHDGNAVKDKITQYNPDIVLLDVMLPGKDGLTICREIRNETKIPVIMLTAKSEELDRVLGLELGADDYITKPFSPRELVARVKAVLRRSNVVPESSNQIRYHGMLLNFETHQVRVENELLDLTAKEFELLWLLASNPGRVFTREHLLDQVWGIDFFGDSRAVDSLIKRVRKKIESVDGAAQYIHTVWGVGYKFEVA